MVVAVYWYTGESVCVQFFTASACRLVKAGLWLYDPFFNLRRFPFLEAVHCLSVQASYVTTCYIDYDLRVALLCYAFLLSGLSIGCLVSWSSRFSLLLSCIQRQSLPHALVSVNTKR